MRFEAKPETKMVVGCAQCGAQFTTYRKESNRQRFCSSTCYHASTRVGRGLKRTATVACAVCGKLVSLAPANAKKRTHCSKPCYAQALRDRPKDSHPRWKGGRADANMLIRNSPQMVAWREYVMRRDGFTCQQCGQVGGELQAHHIKGFADFPDLRFDHANGITLCLKCHKEVHNGRPCAFRR